MDSLCLSIQQRRVHLYPVSPFCLLYPDEWLRTNKHCGGSIAIAHFIVDRKVFLNVNVCFAGAIIKQELIKIVKLSDIVHELQTIAVDVTTYLRFLYTHMCDE